MHLTSSISKADYSKSMTRHLLRTPYMIFTIVLGVFFIGYYALNPEMGRFYLFLGVAFAAMPLITYFGLAPAYDKNKHFNEKVEFVVEESHLELAGQSFSSRFEWSQISKVSETPEFFMFYQGRVLFAILTKKSNDPAAIEELRRLLREKGKMK